MAIIVEPQKKLPYGLIRPGKSISEQVEAAIALYKKITGKDPTAEQLKELQDLIDQEKE